MMNRLACTEYVTDLDAVCNLDLPWNDLKGKTVVVSGATGMIGAFFTDVLMRKNETTELGCNIVALGRSVEKAHLSFRTLNHATFRLRKFLFRLLCFVLLIRRTMFCT